MAGVVELRGLRLMALVGVLPEERERAQPLELDLDVELDLTAAGRTDDLADTVDYGAVCDLVASVVGTGHVVLLERLAEQVADAILGSDGRITGLTVVIRKLRPPVPHDLGTSGVRISRRR